MGGHCQSTTSPRAPSPHAASARSLLQDSLCECAHPWAHTLCFKYLVGSQACHSCPRCSVAGGPLQIATSTATGISLVCVCTSPAPHPALQIPPPALRTRSHPASHCDTVSSVAVFPRDLVTASPTPLGACGQPGAAARHGLPLFPCSVSAPVPFSIFELSDSSHSPEPGSGWGWFLHGEERVGWERRGPLVPAPPRGPVTVPHASWSFRQA